MLLSEAAAMPPRYYRQRHHRACDGGQCSAACGPYGLYLRPRWRQSLEAADPCSAALGRYCGFGVMATVGRLCLCRQCRCFFNFEEERGSARARKQASKASKYTGQANVKLAGNQANNSLERKQLCNDLTGLSWSYCQRYCPAMLFFAVLCLLD